MANVITLDTGAKIYDVQDKTGKHICQISINPTDLNIAKRAEEAIKVLDSMEVEQTAEGLTRAGEIATEQIDYILGEGTASEIFAHVHPFTVLEEGDFFVEKVVDAICKVIEAEMGKRIKKNKSRMEKYTSKYHK